MSKEKEKIQSLELKNQEKEDVIFFKTVPFFFIKKIQFLKTIALELPNMLIYLKVWLWLFFKMLFTQKYIKIIYFLFKKD